MYLNKNLVKYNKTGGPDVLPFKDFEKFWKNIDQESYESGISDSIVNQSLQDVKEQILDFCMHFL